MMLKTTPLDNAIMWESVAKGETDAMVGAWSPELTQSNINNIKIN